MKNQKHAVVMSPTNQFEVLQTQSGNSLFFSIGTDNIFYLTREIPEDTHGWSRADLSTALSASVFNNATVAAKSFDVAQDLNSGTTDIALVVTVNGSDYLFVSLGNINTDDAWAAGIAANTISFTVMPFDDTTHSFNGLAIADVCLVESGTTEYLIADIIIDPTNPTQTIYRYFVDPTKKVFGKYWNPHDISNNLSAGAVTNKLGRKSGQPMDGVYTMGTILDTPQLVYTPLYTITKKGSPDPTVFSPPTGATAMALSVPKAPYTDLFVAAGGSLYYLAYTAQLSGSAPALIYTHALLQGVENLHVNNTASQTVVWGLNEQGQVFYMSCPAGSEANTGAWSYPVSIIDNVEQVATFINGQQGNIVLFGLIADDSGTTSIVQLIQDPTTTHWVERDIKLPTTDTTKYLEDYTFTTHLVLTDDNNVPLNNNTITLEPTGICSVYINNVYHVLYPNTPFTATCDESGGINIVQSTDSLAGICFNIPDSNQPVTTINPMANILAKIGGVNSTDNLNVSVSDETGNSKQLLGSTVTEQQKQDLVTYIQDFMSVKDQVPSDGTLQSGQTLQANANVVANAKTPQIISGLHFGNGGIQYFNSAEQASKLGVVFNGNSLALSAGMLGDDNGLELDPGDCWRWLKSEFEKVETHYLAEIEGITHFFFKLAGELYHCALRCLHDIAAGMHYLLNKIAVAFEDMIKWLGSIFSWIDIVNTHKVLRNLFMQYGNFCIANISTIQSNLNSAVNNAISEINAWAGLPPAGMPTDSYSNQSANNSQDQGQHSAQSNWGHQHAKNNASNADYTNPVYQIETLLDDFVGAVMVEGDILINSLDQITDIISEIHTMPLDELMKRLVAVIADAVLESGVNVADQLLNVAEVLLEGIMDQLIQPINIPVLSPLYHFYTGEELSIFDVLCLVMAVQVNVVYKLANNGEAPFPNDDSTKAIYNAPDLESFVRACVAQDPVSAEPQLTANASASLQLTLPKPVWSDPQNKKWTNIGNYCAFGGSILVSAFGAAKLKCSEGKAGNIIAILYGGSYLPYIAPDVIGCVQYFWQPNTNKNWINDINFALGGIGAIKAFIDIKLVGAPPFPRLPGPGIDPTGAPILPPDPGVKVKSWADPKKFALEYRYISPFVECGLNLLWEVPVALTFSYSNKNKNDVLLFVGNTLFNIGGALTPIGTFGPPNVSTGIAIAQTVCNLGYGCMTMATSLD